MCTINTVFNSWNEHSAYLLGFWFADGYITIQPRGKTNRKIWGLANTNHAGLINCIKQFSAKIPNPIKKREVHHKQCYHFRVRSEHMFDFCYNLTKTTRKSDNKLSFPAIPADILHHFVRGYFDGDGSIHNALYKTRHNKIVCNLRTSFTAGNNTGPWLYELRDLLHNTINTGNKKVVIGSNSSKLAFGQYDSYLLCTWMYRDATIFFENKKEIWDNADKTKLIGSSKYFSNKV